MTNCPLCLSAESKIMHHECKQVYQNCAQCGLIFLDPDSHLSPAKEKAHYETHNNDVTDPRYQKFVSPIVDYVLEHFDKSSSGLDYGAGPGPVITSMLKKENYDMSIYDPYFESDPDALDRYYDFIVVSEVVEHFYNPSLEFEKLKSRLKPSGALIIMTYIFKDELDFGSWHYRQDPTHVVFYRDKTFEWIKENYSYKSLEAPHPRVRVLKTL